VAKLLGAIDEADFLDCSYGYRPGRSAKDAVRDLSLQLTTAKFGYLVEADIRGFFEHMDHDWLLKMLSLRIDDRAFLNLICKWLKAGILDTDGTVLHPETRTPQGGIVSPVLANLYLHYALGFELFWFIDREGIPRVKRRTARKRLQGAIRRIKEWIKSHRHLPDMEFIKGLNRRLVGHYNYYGLRGNSADLWRFYRTAVVCAFKWLNRRGGKRKSFTWAAFGRAIEKLGIAKPRITESRCLQYELVFA